MDKPKINLSPPHRVEQELEFIKKALVTNEDTEMKSAIKLFEKEIANFLGVKGAVATNSGTAAMHLALSLLGITSGDKVFCSTLNSIESANPILYLGAEAVFIDSEPETWNMSPVALTKALQEAYKEGELPKAVIIGNLYGRCARIDELQLICAEYNVPIIEDASESFGSMYKGQPIGSFGDFSVLSFSDNKMLTAFGGGMLVSSNGKALDKARFLSTHAREPATHNQHSVTGFDYSMSNVLAGVGRAQLEVIEDRIEERREIFMRYYRALLSLPGIGFMPELRYTRSNRLLTVLTLNEEEAGLTNKELLFILQSRNIEARPIWKPLHLQPLFKNSTYFSHGYREHVARGLFFQGLCLPSSSTLTKEEQDRVIDCVVESVTRMSSQVNTIENMRY